MVSLLLHTKDDDAVYNLDGVIDGWADWQIAFNRSTLSASAKTVTFPLKFTGAIADILYQKYSIFKVQASASILIADKTHIDAGAILFSDAATYNSTNKVALIKELVTANIGTFARSVQLGFSYITREDTTPEGDFIENLIAYTVTDDNGALIKQGYADHNNVDDTLYTTTIILPYGYTGKLTLRFFNSLDWDTNSWADTTPTAYVKNVTIKEHAFFDNVVLDNVEEFDINFATTEKTDRGIQMSLKSLGLRENVKKFGNTEYVIPFTKVAAKQKFKHMRVTLDNILTMRRADFDSVATTSGTTNGTTDYAAPVIAFPQTYSMGLAYDSSDTPVKDSVMYTEVDAGTTDYFVQIQQKGTFTIEYKSESELNAVTMIFKTGTEYNNYVSQFYASPYPKFQVRYRLIKNGTTVLTTALYDLSKPTYPVAAGASSPKAVFMWANTEYNKTLLTYTGTLQAGNTVSTEVVILINGTVTLNPILLGRYAAEEVLIAGVGSLNVKYAAKSTTQRELLCCTPKALLKELFNKMGAPFAIVDDVSDDFGGAILVPPDVLNGVAAPNIKISYNKLYGFLRMLCCDIKMTGSNATIVKLHSNANAAYIASESLNYPEEDVADLQISVVDDLLYSTINIGSTADITGANADREFNQLCTYTLDLPTTNSLDLTTAIRTDSVGFESLVNDNPLKESTAATEIFAIAAELDANGIYYKATATTVGNVASDMMNGKFNPRALMLRWTRLLGFTDIIVLKSTAANKDKVVNGVRIGGNISSYEEAYFNNVILPEQLDIATADHVSFIGRDALDGYMTFPYKGTTYKGFIVDATENPMKPLEKKLKLHTYGNGVKPTAVLNLVVEKATYNITGTYQTVQIDFTLVGQSAPPAEELKVISTAEWVHASSMTSFGAGQFRLMLDIDDSTGTVRTSEILLRVGDKSLHLAVVTQDVNGSTTIYNTTATVAYGSFSDDVATIYSEAAVFNGANLAAANINGFVKNITFTATYNGTTDTIVGGFPALMAALEYVDSTKLVLHVYSNTNNASVASITVSLPLNTPNNINIPVSII